MSWSRTRTMMGAVLAAIAITIASTSLAQAARLRVSIRRINLPSAQRYEGAAVQASADGSLWVVGAHHVWSISRTGHVLRTVALPEGAFRMTDTATTTEDGGVSFVNIEQSPNPEGLMLSHVTATGTLSELPLLGLPPLEIPDGPMLAAAGSLWAPRWSDSAAGAEGALISIGPTTGQATSYPPAMVPYTINQGPGGDFWIGGTDRARSRRLASLVTPTGVAVKTVGLPGEPGNDLMSAGAPGTGVWYALSGYAVHLSSAGAVRSYRLPHGTCEAPYGVASEPNGTALVLGIWPTGAQCDGVAKFPMQLVKIAHRHVSAVSLRLPGTFGIPLGLATFADGKLWVIGGDARSLSLALYALTVH